MNPPPTTDENGVRWVSAHDWIEQRTREFARRFTTSTPRPRNRVMGFRGEDRPKGKKGRALPLT